MPVAGGIATYSGAGSPLNKFAGLGFGGPLESSELAAVERAFDSRGVPLQVELASLADPAIGAQLTKRDYALVGFENVLGRALPVTGSIETDRSAPASQFEIAESPAAELASWIDVLVTGFAHPDAQGIASHEHFPRAALERVMADVSSADGFVRYLVRSGNELAAGASMRICDGIAQLTGAATLPAFRRRGLQSKLLIRRLELAGEAGCDLAVITTQPGSKSQENSQRQGFSLLYTRAILVRQPRATGSVESGDLETHRP